MKKVLFAMVFVVMLMVPLTASADNGAGCDCDTITAGELMYSPGRYLEDQTIPTGFDVYGYNYQAHTFKGSYFNMYANGDGLPPYTGDDVAYLAANPGVEVHWAWPYRNDNVVMKWNDAWLSNKDCDGDDKMDNWDTNGGRGSGAWMTNHISGSYEFDGKTYRWNWFVKIVAVPDGAYFNSPFWYTAEGQEIGPAAFGDESEPFAIVQDVYSDTGTGEHGLFYVSPAGPGLGKW